MPHPAFTNRPRHRQRRGENGAVLVQFALLLGVLVAVLGTVQIGHMYYAKRDLQRIADLAALEAANALAYGDEGTRQKAVDAGAQSIAAQWPPTVSAIAQTVTPGHWETAAPGTLSASGPLNAAQVTLEGESLQLVPFTGSRTIRATAIAAIAQEPIAAFSLGSGVARLDAGALNRLLTMLLGTSVNLSLVDYEGLANARLNLLGLKDALNLQAGTYEELAAANISLGQLLSIAATAIANAPDADSANIAIDALNGILALPVAVNLSDIFINLLKTDSQRGLLDIGLFADRPASALAADVSALNLLLVGLQVANADSAIALQTGINLAPLANVELKAKIIEPPVIAIGPPGYTGDGTPRTSAHTGQVRVFANIQALTPLGGNNNLLYLPLLLANVRVSAPAGQLLELPVYAEVAPADGILDNISCHYQGRRHRVGIDVHPGLARVFLGHVPGAFDNTGTAWDFLAKDRFNLLSLKLEINLLFGLIPVVDAPISLKAKLNLDVDRPAPEMAYFSYDASIPRTEQNLVASVGSRQALGQSIANAINAGLLDVELDTSGLALLGIELGLVSDIVDGLVNSLATLVSGVLALLNGILMPVLALLDGLVLGPLLELLGVQLGYADVELLSVDCDAARLVY